MLQLFSSLIFLFKIVVTGLRGALIILVNKQIGLPLGGSPILVVTQMIADRIRLHFRPVTINEVNSCDTARLW